MTGKLHSLDISCYYIQNVFFPIHVVRSRPYSVRFHILDNGMWPPKDLSCRVILLRGCNILYYRKEKIHDSQFRPFSVYFNFVCDKLCYKFLQFALITLGTPCLTEPITTITCKFYPTVLNISHRQGTVPYSYARNHGDWNLPGCSWF